MSQNRGAYDFILFSPYQVRFFYERLLLALNMLHLLWYNFSNLDLVFIEMIFIFVDFMNM